MNSEVKMKNEKFGKELENVLREMGLFCVLINIKDNEISTKYEFELQNLKDFQKLSKAIKIMALCYHKDIRLVESEITHFGIEIRKDTKTLNSTNYQNDTNKALLGIGSNGEKVVFDIKKSIHTLIAGATGMGKTNIINNIIYSLAQNNTRDNLKIHLIDMKKTLSIWDGLPQIESDTAQTPTQALLKLKSISTIIEERLTKLSKQKKAFADEDTFPRIVVIIDELADLMLTGLKQYIEDQIIHIAQIGRSANVSLIIATQSPIAKVCTNLIKANCPTVIALKTVSIPTSRVILDNKNAFELSGVGECIIRNADYPNEKQFKALYLDENDIIKFVKEKKNEYIQQKKKNK